LSSKIISLELIDIKINAQQFFEIISLINVFKNLEKLTIINSNLKNIEDKILKEKIIEKLKLIEKNNITIISPFSY
jgi:hypothetical protein